MNILDFDYLSLTMTDVDLILPACPIPQQSTSNLLMAKPLLSTFSALTDFSWLDPVTFKEVF